MSRKAHKALSKSAGWIYALAIVGALCASALSQPAFAQVSGRVSGTIKDPSGAVIPGATVILRDQASGTELKTVTDSSGFYNIDPVPPKTYDLVVQMQGFNTYTERGVVVSPAARLELSITLTVGTQVQEVQVTAAATQLMTTTSGAKTDVIGSSQIMNLSTEGRNAMELLTLLPGIATCAPGQSSMGAMGCFSAQFGTSTGQGINNFNVNGLRNDQNSIRLDSSNMIDPGNAGGFIIEPNMDMIQEFSVKTSSFEADQGRAALIVEAVTKSGGSRLHGEAYYYARQGVLNANDWSNNNFGTPKPGTKMNYPGFNIGGPVRIPGSDFNKKNDKMFFFGAFELQHQLPDFGTGFAVVPSQAMRQGDFTELKRGVCAGRSRCLNMPTQLRDPQTWGTPIASNMLPASEINANSALLLNQYPLPNYVDTLGRYNFTANPLYPLNRSEENIRVDYNVTESTRMYVRLARNYEKQFYPWGLWSGLNSGWTSNVPETALNVGNNLGQAAAFNIVNVINPTLTNEFQFNAQMFSNPNHFTNPKAYSKSAFGFKFSGMTFQNAQVPAFQNGVQYTGDEMPQITDQWNFYNGGNPGTGRWGEGDVSAGIFAANTEFEFLDNVTKVHGTHTLKFGGNLDRNRKDQNGGPVTEGLLITAENWGGMTTGNSFGDILANNFAGFQQGLPNNEGLWRFTNLEWYAQDSWKARRRLTLNYGARFSFMQPWYEVRGKAETFLTSAYNPSNPTSFINGILTAQSGKVSSGVFPNPKPILQPRIGLAWDVFGTGRTVVRGGLGTYVSRDQGNVAFYMSNSDPFTFSATVTAPGPFLTLEQIQAKNPFSNVGNIGIQALDPRDPNQPQTYEWNFGLDQNVGLKTVVSAAYVANVSRHLYRQQDLNVINPGGMWIPGTTDCCANGDTNTPDYRPYKPYGSINWSTHSDTANYNSLQVSLRRNVSHGLTLLGSYTWSKTLGYTNSFQGTVDPFNSKKSYGLLPWDHASILNLSYIYQLPSLAEKHFSSSKVAKGVLDGWQFSGITHFTSGAPVVIGNPTINCMTAPNADGSPAATNLCQNNALENGSRFQGSGIGWYGTPDLIEFNTTNAAGNGVRPFINWVGGNFKHVGDHWFSPSSVSLPNIGQFGTLVEPTFRAPGSSDWDMTLFKTFRLGETRRLEFRFATFNAFNHANLGTGGAYFQTTPIFNWVLPQNAKHFSDGTPVLANGDQLGVITNKVGHREVEFALKLFF